MDHHIMLCNKKVLAGLMILDDGIIDSITSLLSVHLSEKRGSGNRAPLQISQRARKGFRKQTNCLSPINQFLSSSFSSSTILDDLSTLTYSNFF
jgi:hypothetical protein